MRYFAYGSNMLTARLARRVPSARPLGAARLPGHVLRFHKRGDDGSGKCNALSTGGGGDVVHGVLFEVDGDRLDRLHAAEGPGYAFDEVEVDAGGETLPAVTYRARSAWLDDALAPYTWYQAFVVAGAREHGLPPDYVTAIENVFARRDPNLWRHLRNRWIRGRGPRAAAGTR
ncbi:AIG2 family protein [Salinisphaera sp. PC39]|uniref:gamma-glutamylcyclotransferase family protein n=1 Tax=Salinisphaera sp. PC39 TaxID=1304156 RepID=UPI00333E48D6